MEIKKLYDNNGNVHPEERGIIEESEIEYAHKESYLRLTIGGNIFNFRTNNTGVPTICVGAEVILHLKSEEESATVFGIQIIEGDSCILRASNMYGWVSFK